MRPNICRKYFVLFSLFYICLTGGKTANLYFSLSDLHWFYTFSLTPGRDTIGLEK